MKNQMIIVCKIIIFYNYLFYNGIKFFKIGLIQLFDVFPAPKHKYFQAADAETGKIG